jgi:hypothetical protein
VPPHPVVRADSQVLAQIEAKLDMRALIQQGIDTVQMLDFVQENRRVRATPGALSTTSSATGEDEHG